jgi:hypothetical protein
MLIAGDATITNSMIVEKLSGKSIYGSYLEGGELLIRGTDNAAVPTTGTYTNFETTSDTNVWAVTFDTGAISRDSNGKSGYCVKGVSTATTSDKTNYYVQSMLNTRYLDTLSGWNLSSCPYDGITTVSCWVKSSVADTLTVAWFDFQNANGDTIAINKTVDVAANTWTQIKLTGPAGYRPTLTNNPLLPTFFVQGQKAAVSSGATRTLWVDEVTWSNVADTASAVHVYRDAMGSPSVEVIDYQGLVRAKLAAPSSSAAGLTFYADDGEYVFSADGLSAGSRTVPWGDLLDSVSDSGWKWLYGPYGDTENGVKYRKTGKVLCLIVDLGSNSNKTITNSGVSLGTLPIAYRPVSAAISAATGKGNNFGQIRVDTSGVVTCWLFGSNSVYFGGSVTYQI